MKTGRARIAAAVLLIALGAAGLVMGLLLHTQKGVRIGEFLSLQRDGAFRSGHAELLTEETENGLRGTYRVGEQSIDVTMEFLNERQLRFLLPDGSSLRCNIEPKGKIKAESDFYDLQEAGELEDWGLAILEQYGVEAGQGQGRQGLNSLCNALWRVYRNDLESRGSWMFSIAYLIVFALGFWMTLFPEEAHLLGQYWQYRRGRSEMESWRILMMRIGGIVLMLLGLAIALSPMITG